MSRAGLAGAFIGATQAAEKESRRQKSIANELALIQQMQAVQLQQQQISQQAEQAAFTRTQQSQILEQQERTRQEEAQAKEQSQRALLSAQAVEAANDRASRELIAQRAQRGQLVRTALQKGVTLDPETQQEFGIMQQAAAARRAAPGPSRAGVPGVAQPLAPTPVTPTTEPGPGVSPFAAISPGEVGRFAPGAVRDPGDTRGIPAGAGFIREEDGTITAIEDQPLPEIEPLSPDQQAQIDVVNSLPLPPSVADSFRRAAESGQMTMKDLIREGRLFIGKRDAVTPLEKAQTEALRDEEIIRSILQTNDPGAIGAAAVEFGLIEEGEEPVPSEPVPGEPGDLEFAKEVNKLSIQLMGIMEKSRIVRSIDPKKPTTTPPGQARVHTPTDKASFNSIPVGGLYRHPKDGQIYRKR